MADISSEINKITEAVLGEEVRGSIKDALLKMNDEIGKGATKVTPTEVDNASKCVAEGTFYKVLIDGAPSIITTSLDAGGATGVQYRFASTGSGSTGAIYYRVFTVNPFTAGEWINVSATIDQTILEGIVDRYLETIGIDEVVERKENRTTYDVSASTDIYSDSTSGPSIDIEDADNTKYPSLKAIKQLTGACIFSMPEMFKNETDPDDTNSIQKAINYAVRRNIPFRCAKNKEYVISSPITIRIIPNYFGCVEFDFCNATLRMDNELQQDCILKYNSGVASNEETIYPHAVVKNVVLDGYFESAETGLYIQHSNGDIFENIMVYNTVRGIYVLAGSETRITNCTIRRNIVKVYNPDVFYTMGRKVAYGFNNESATTWECEITPAKIKGAPPNASDVVYWDDEYSGSEEGTSYSAIAEYQNGDVVYTSGGKKWQLHSPNGSTIVNFQPKSSNTSGKIIWNNNGKYKDLDISVEESSEDKITLEDGSTIIDPNTTNFVGIDCREDSTDMWVENCVIINYVVGIAVRSGDTKIIACHPWISGENIVKTAIAYYNKGTNYYSDCTCDRFKIGFYCGDQAPIYLTNSHISSKPDKNMSETFEAYCFYIPSTVSHKGRKIHAVNTEIHGIKDSWHIETGQNKNVVTIPKNWTNIPGGCINDVNTFGYGSLNYMNSNLKTGEEYKKLIYTDYSIGLDTSQIKTDLIEQTVPTNPVISPGASEFGMKSTVVNWRIFQSPGTHLCYRLEGNTGNNQQVQFYIVDLSNVNIENPILLTVSYQTNVLGAALRIKNGKQIPLQTDNEEHSIGIIIDAEQYSDLKVFMQIITSENTTFNWNNGSNTYFYLWNIMAFDWNGIKNNIARYYLEDFGHYLNRISKYIDSTLSESNPTIKSAINIEAPTNQKVLCKSEKCAIDIDNMVKDALTEYPHYYKTRYNAYGRPIITVDDINKDTEQEFASITTSAPYMSIGIFEPDAGYKILKFNQNGTNTSPINQDNVITYSAINGPIKMIVDIPVTEKENATTHIIERIANTGHIESLRFGTDYLEPDTRLTSNGEIIKCYPDGKIYAVMLDSEDADDLPTFAYTLEDI